MENQIYYDCNSLPSNTYDKYWLYCIKENYNECNNIGKWMLFFNKKYMDEKSGSQEIFSYLEPRIESRLFSNLSIT